RRLGGTRAGRQPTRQSGAGLRPSHLWRQKAERPGPQARGAGTAGDRERAPAGARTARARGGAGAGAAAALGVGVTIAGIVAAATVDGIVVAAARTVEQQEHQGTAKHKAADDH